MSRGELRIAGWIKMRPTPAPTIVETSERQRKLSRKRQLEALLKELDGQ